MQAAAKFGGSINDLFGWIVDLENFDLEVLLNIVDSHVVVGISLTKESLFRRNIVNFGPTTLKSTLAYCLALAADIKKGEIGSPVHRSILTLVQLQCHSLLPRGIDKSRLFLHAWNSLRKKITQIPIKM